jgi:hypothetical protein
MGLKGYRLWVMGQLDSTCRAPPRRTRRTAQPRAGTRAAWAPPVGGLAQVLRGVRAVEEARHAHEGEDHQLASRGV